MTRKFIKLVPALVNVSRRYGVDVVAWYARDPRRTAMSGQWGVELDPIRQGQAKAGEFAVARYLGVDTSTINVNHESGPDDGKDLIAHGIIRIDAKTTPTWKDFVIWPMPIRDSYHRKTFTHLVGVSINNDDWSECWIEGYMTKQEFWERKLIADGIVDRNPKSGKAMLAPGTWYVPKVWLNDIETLAEGVADPAPPPVASGTSFISKVAIKKFKPPTKYELMSDLLGAFGDNRITRDQFWGQMKERGYTQEDIDQWCEQYHQLTKGATDGVHKAT
jgi:hypothetical protein